MSMKDFVTTLNEEQKKALLKALSEDSTTSVNISTNAKNTTKAITDDDFTMSQPTNLANKKRKEPVKARQNMWTDTGESKDIITPNINPTPRTRKLPSKINLQCHVCGKDFEVDKRFVFGEYNRCDRCASKK